MERPSESLKGDRGVLFAYLGGAPESEDAAARTRGSAGTARYPTGGSRPGGGQNLFHSFGRFSVGVGDTAQFKNTTPNLVTRNILSRLG